MNKILGYILLALGLLLIFGVIFQSYTIFTGASQPPLIFKVQPPVQNAPAAGSADVQAQINKAMSSQLGAMIGPETLPKILNLTSWSIFATLLFVAGGQIAGIGVKLIKT